MIEQQQEIKSIEQEQIGALNEIFRPLSPKERIEKLYEYFDTSEVMLTSSFAATSALLLKLFSEVNLEQEVLFIDTGYHFEETLTYKEYLTQLYGIKVREVSAANWQHEITTKEEMWKTDPDLCCSVNKVEPLQALKASHSVWVSGLMKWQSDHRASLDIFEERNGIIKFYPLLDVSKEEREEFISSHHLPFHPLISRGYSSIGCSHCTVPGDDRNGRWNNSPKTECGLHL